MGGAFLLIIDFYVREGYMKKNKKRSNAIAPLRVVKSGFIL